MTPGQLKRARLRYREQHNNALARGIAWHFDFDTWFDVWLRSGHWHERGRRRGQYVMHRRDDTGEYSTANVVIITNAANPSRAHLGRRRPPEVRAKISAAKMGHPVSLETRRKMSLATKHFYERRTASERSERLSPTDTGTSAFRATGKQNRAMIANVRKHRGSRR
jgi:NUMOD3 motif-containing protein